MNILLIAPDNLGLNTIPEIRTLTELHKTYVLNGTVTINDIQNIVSHTKYDAIHFATHLANTKNFTDILLSNNEILDRDELVQIIKNSKCKLVFFNLCSAARLGAFVSRRTDASAIFTTIDLDDRDAWKIPLLFYTECSILERNKKLLIFKEIFNFVDEETSKYGFSSSSKYADYILEPIFVELDELRTNIGLAKNDISILNNDLKLVRKQVNLLEHVVDQHSDELDVPEVRQDIQKSSDKWIFYLVIIMTAVSSLITVWSNSSG